MFGIIKRSQITGELLKARADERKLCEKEYQCKTEQIVREQRGLHEIQIQGLGSEIDSLNRIIERNSNVMQVAHEREANAKKIYLKAKAIICQMEFEINKYLEGNAALLGQFRQIKDDAEAFSRRLIDE